VMESRRSKIDANRRLAGAYRDVDTAATAPGGEVEYPKDWAEKTKRRKKPNYTVKEELILRALASPVSATFKGTRFQGVIDQLQEATGQNIIVDKATLEAANVSYDTEVTLNAKGWALRTVLRKVLGNLGLAYVIKDEEIQIVTAEQAKDMMTVRTYYLGDLVGLPDWRLGPALGEARAEELANQIMDLIRSSIDPNSWDVNHGLGTIKYEPRTRTLIIRQSAEVHSMLGSSLH